MLPSYPASLAADTQFLQEVKRLPPLTTTEEATLLSRVRHGGREAAAARTRLIEGYQPLVIKMAKRYASACTHLQFLDFIQEGNLGLLDALNHYGKRTDPGRFRSWALSWVRGAILDAFWRSEALIRLPRYKARALWRVRRAQRSLLNRFGREPRLEELVTYLRLPERAVLELVGLLAQQTVGSLSAAPHKSDETIRELVHCDAPDATAQDQPRLHAWLRGRVAQLPERERSVVSLRYGFADGQTHSYREIADLLGLAASTVEDIDRQVRLRLRPILEPRFRSIPPEAA
jgi:RNA polymerase primary sigma factor